MFSLASAAVISVAVPPVEMNASDEQPSEAQLVADEALLAWLETFPNVDSLSSAKALRDGSVLMIAGVTLSSEHFDPASLAATEDDNWMVYLTNLKRFSASLEDYCCAEAAANPTELSECLDSIDINAAANKYCTNTHQNIVKMHK